MSVNFLRINICDVIILLFHMGQFMIIWTTAILSKADLSDLATLA